MARVPTIRRYNGNDIEKSTRLSAKANFKKLDAELKVLAQKSKEKKEFEKKEGKFNPNAYTPESRWAYYLEEKEREEESEKKSKENSMFKDYYEFNKEKGPLSIFNDHGIPRQCN